MDKDLQQHLDENINKTNEVTVLGARVHNLKNIDVEIPKNKLCVITGPSGSGKSTLMNYVLGQKISITSHRPQT